MCANVTAERLQLPEQIVLKEEAQEVDDKLNKYFQELINPNKELWQKK